MLHLILADSEIELIPPKLMGHPSVRRHADRRGKRAAGMLLDDSYHHSAITRYLKDDDRRRGRPDIAHIFLVLAQESLLNKQGLMRTYIHTRNDEVIYIDPKMRVPKAYHRFVGLLESLYQNKTVPSRDNPLLRLVSNMTLNDLCSSIDAETYIMNEVEGRALKDVSLDVSSKDVTIIIGGFPHGDFRSDITFIPQDNILSLGKDKLMAYVCAFEVIADAERDTGIL